MANKRTVTLKSGRTFELSAHRDFHGAMICYSIDEVVRPSWKIFRTKYCDSGMFWLSDFDSVEDGLLCQLSKYLESEQYDLENLKKYQDFVNGSSV